MQKPNESKSFRKWLGITSLHRCCHPISSFDLEKWLEIWKFDRRRHHSFLLSLEFRLSPVHSWHVAILPWPQLQQMLPSQCLSLKHALLQKRPPFEACPSQWPGGLQIETKHLRPTWRHLAIYFRYILYIQVSSGLWHFIRLTLKQL